VRQTSSCDGEATRRNRMELILLALCCFTWLTLRLLLFRQHKSHVKTMAVLGSGAFSPSEGSYNAACDSVYYKPKSSQFHAGGHTAELFRVMNELDKVKFAPRVYVVANTDKLGALKAQQHEQQWSCLETVPPSKSIDAKVHRIPRSREVGQSWVTSAFSTAWATIFAASVVLKERPGLLLVNGPGTCLPLCLVAHVARCLALLNTKIVFVESIARTRQLSLTGKIIYYFRLSDLFLVQWPGLRQQFPRSKCLGRVY
jgi:beta-1,4-N-acetylglucosaminyltransferase